jgi:hypothetical protein
MPEVVGAFLSTELWHERANCSVEPWHSARSDLAQQGLEFAVGHLDGIEIGRVLWQVANCRLRLLNRLPDAGYLVDSAPEYKDGKPVVVLGASAVMPPAEPGPASPQ